MKAKLIKTGVHYTLYHRIAEDNLIIGFASTDNTFEKKLSLKNCQAIERGYDLDELAEKEYFDGCDNTERSSEIYRRIFKEGFQKALELMKHRLVEETEWQVEVLMDICGDKVYAVPEPVLDEQGCLILKPI